MGATAACASIGNGNKENYIEICNHDKLGSIPYTRTDTIPSRAEVAREFMDRLINELAFYCDGTHVKAEYCGKILLREWEDAESK